METANLELALRKGFRYASKVGAINTEDLYGLTLENLDYVAINLNKQLKESQEESFVKAKTNATKELQEKLNIVVHIINLKKDELEAVKVMKQKSIERARLAELISKKQDEALGSKSLEELQKEYEATFAA